MEKAHWHKHYEECDKYCPMHPDYKKPIKKGPYKVAIVGSREFTDYSIVKEALDNIKDKIALIISGGAKGVDTLAQRYACENGIPIHIYYPNYSKYGKKAPFVRNVVIANLAEYMIAFGHMDSKGTRHVVNKMKELNKPYMFFQFMGNGVGVETNLIEGL